MLVIQERWLFSGEGVRAGSCLVTGSSAEKHPEKMQGLWGQRRKDSHFIGRRKGREEIDDG